jgi:hypothetical protein
MLKRRTSPHRAANGGCGFSQLFNQAFQASNKLSLPHPGNASQGTGTQRLRACTTAGAFTTAGALTAGERGDSTGALVAMGTLPQAASVPTIASQHPHIRTRLMTLLLLEALGAGLIFVGIIWWTMFSGRENGELPQDDDKDKNSH